MFGTSVIVVTGPWEVLVVKYPPRRDQTSSQKRCCFLPHSHITVGKPISWLEAEMHTEPFSPELPTGSVDWLIFSTSLIFGLLISHMLVFTSLPNPGCVHFLRLHPLSVNQTHTMDQSFLCYQMVARSRLVIRKLI